MGCSRSLFLSVFEITAVMPGIGTQTHKDDPYSFIQLSSRFKSVDPTELDTLAMANNRSFYASPTPLTPTCVMGTCFTRSPSSFI